MTDAPNLRDHLFISYAWEDGALAEWLALRLTAEGYFVWCDRFKLLGGESWPKDIDAAIKERTFRMLQLVSAHSLNKENPTKERQLALALQRERKAELYIPLNVDGTRPGDLNWQLSDITYIEFQDWGAGLRQLLKKLRAVDAPRPRGEAGRGVAASALMAPDVLVSEPERLHSNWYPFVAVPPAIQRFIAKAGAAEAVASGLADHWPCRRTGKANDTFLSLVKPPSGNEHSRFLRPAGGVSWADVERIDGLSTSALLMELLNKALLIRCRARGLKQVAGHDTLYFPPGLVPNERLPLALPSGAKSRIRVLGRRRSGTGHFLYNLGFVLRARRGSGSELVAQLRLRLHITNELGEAVSPRSAFRRSVRVRRGWWNRQQLLRQAAVIEFLAEGKDRVPVWSEPSVEFAFSRAALSFEIPVRLDEKVVTLAGEEFVPLSADSECEVPVEAVSSEGEE